MCVLTRSLLESVVIRVTAGHIIPLSQWSIYLLDGMFLWIPQPIYASNNVINDAEQNNKKTKPSNGV